MGKKKSVKKRKSARKKEGAKKQEEKKADPEAPQEEAGEGESASGLFKEAIAAFEDAGALLPAGSETKAAAEADAPDEQKEAEKEKGRKEGGEEADEEADKKREGEGEKGPAEPAKAEAEVRDGREAEEVREAKEAGEPERAGEAEKAEEVEQAEKVQEVEAARPAASAEDDRMVRKVVRRKGEPGGEVETYEPKEYEVHGDVIKFECRCGKRVSAPLKAKHSIGKCPKCGVRLVLPKPGMKPDMKAGEKGGTEADAEASSKTEMSTGEKARPADAAAAASPAGSRAPSAVTTEPASRGPTPPTTTWIMRFVAFQIDLAVPAGLFFAVFYLLRSLEVEPAVYWTVALAAAGGAWLVAAIALPAAVSGSLGMLMVGLRYCGPDGRPLTFIEAVGRGVAGLVFSPLAPLSLADPEGRTTADHVTGCAVVSVGQEAMGAAPAHGQAPRLAAAEKRDAPDTVRKRRWETRRRGKKPR